MVQNMLIGAPAAGVLLAWLRRVSWLRFCRWYYKQTGTIEGLEKLK